MIRVGVLGAGGRMGQHVCQAVIDDPELELVAAVDPHHAGIDLDQVGLHGTGLQMAAGPQALSEADAEVAVDFTVLDAARKNLEWCADHSVHAVVGTTGFTAEELEALRKRFAEAGANAVIAPNFALGAVLMMRLAELAAPFFDTAEVIELHHDNKVDAPSGTAMMTVQRIADASSDWAADPTKSVVAEGARGGIGPGGIRVHSLRIRGLVAHHEVVLGTTGQSLTIRHDSYDRTSYMPGVLLAIRRVREQPARRTAALATKGGNDLGGWERADPRRTKPRSRVRRGNSGFAWREPRGATGQDRHAARRQRRGEDVVAARRVGSAPIPPRLDPARIDRVLRSAHRWPRRIRDRPPGHGPGHGRPTDLRRAHRRRESACRCVLAARPRRCEELLRQGARPVPGAEGAPPPDRRVPLRRRAADGRDGAGDDGRAQADVARRAVAGVGAAHRATDP